MGVVGEIGGCRTIENHQPDPSECKPLFGESVGFDVLRYSSGPDIFESVVQNALIERHVIYSEESV